MFVLWWSMFIDDSLTASLFELLHLGYLKLRPSLPDCLPPCDLRSTCLFMGKREKKTYTRRIDHRSESQQDVRLGKS